MVADLTALPIANASLLDEATAAAEAMNLTEAVAKVPPGTTPMFMIAEGCHPQTIAVVRTRAEAHDRDRLRVAPLRNQDRKSTRLNSSHTVISYAGFCLKKKKKQATRRDSNRTTEP